MIKKNLDRMRAKKQRKSWPINPVVKIIPNKKKNKQTGNRRSLEEDAFSYIKEKNGY